MISIYSSDFIVSFLVSCYWQSCQKVHCPYTTPYSFSFPFQEHIKYMNLAKEWRKVEWVTTVRYMFGGNPGNRDPCARSSTRWVWPWVGAGNCQVRQLAAPCSDLLTWILPGCRTLTDCPPVHLTSLSHFPNIEASTFPNNHWCQMLFPLCSVDRMVCILSQWRTSVVNSLNEYYFN